MDSRESRHALNTKSPQLRGLAGFVCQHFKVDTQAGGYQLITFRNDRPVGDLWMGKPDVIREVSSRLADEFRVIQNSILHAVVYLELRAIHIQ